MAGELAAALNWAVVDSDALRKDLGGIDHDDHRVELHPDLYSSEMDERVYRELCRQAGVLLRAGESVILDATWAQGWQRELACDVADEHGAEVSAVECTLAAEVAAERVRLRREQGVDASDATPELAVRLADRRDTWPTAFRIDTDCSTDTIVAALVGHLTGPSVVQ